MVYILIEICNKKWWNISDLANHTNVLIFLIAVLNK